MNTRKNYSWLKHIDFMFLDLLCLIFAFTISYRMKFDNFCFIDSEAWRTFVFIICMIDVMVTVLSCAYSGVIRCKGYEIYFRSLKLAFYSFAAACMVFYLFKIGANYSREAMLVMYGIYFLISSVVKNAWQKCLIQRHGSSNSHNTYRKLLVVSDRGKIRDLLENLRAGDFCDFEVNAIFLHQSGCGQNEVTADIKDTEDIETIEGIPVMHSGLDYVSYVLKHYVDEVFIDSKYLERDKSKINCLIENGVGINVSVEGLFGMETDNQYLKRVGICKTLSVGNFDFSNEQKVYLFFKRCIDLVFGVMGCVLLIPVFVFVKTLYMLNGDHAPVIYKQERIGRNGKRITIYKFRTMQSGAEEMLIELLKEEKYRQEWECEQKLSDDPRITSVGHFLRKASLDELPQFINVLKGEMSLVGPRPLVEGELEQHNGLKLYQKVKPGITGWWACNGRSNISYRERLELEYHYVKHCSLKMDLMCMFRTIACVMTRRGAV